MRVNTEAASWLGPGFVPARRMMSTLSVMKEGVHADGGGRSSSFKFAV